MRDWLNEMTAREKIMIGAAIILGLSVLVYQFAYRPLSAARASAIAAYERQLTQSNLIQQGLIRLELKQEQKASVDTSESLELLLSRTANAKGLQIVRLQPAEGDGLLVWFDQAETRTLAVWIEEMETANGLAVLALDLRRQSGQPGLRGSVTFRRSN